MVKAFVPSISRTFFGLIMPQINVQNYIFGSGYLTLLLALFIRWCIALHSFSGERKPPMYGDYEAQRHWMEITYNLNIRDWYKDTVDNNLTYWGLDYPPLTAYHSYICGFLASVFVPDSIRLHSSRGYESHYHKWFMRMSVFVSDLLIYLPAVYWYFKSNFKSKDSYAINLSRFFALLFPGLILIDYGHFQYNCVSLGLFVAAVAAICDNRDILASFLFSLAVNYKQMELYHSLPFFFFFLGKFALLARKQSFSSGITFLFPIASTVLVTFFVVWFPFLFDFEDAKNVFRRIFPVTRGLYEDKVSTFWCVLNVFYKIHRTVDDKRMVIVCLVTTLISVIPSLIDLFIRPSVEKLKLSLIISSFCFFLFSYHVHEKSILLVAIPVILDFGRQPTLSFWFLSISTFSMLPLLIADKLFLPYLALLTFYCLCAVVFLAKYDARSISIGLGKIRLKSIVVLSLSGCLFLSFVLKFCPNPARYPYLWSLAVCSYSFAHFILFLSYYYVKQCRSWIVVRKTRKD